MEDDVAKKKPVPRKKAAPASSVASALPVVCIGASAGGLEALEEFFKAMPADSGMAFVVIQHLDPTRHSGLTEILARFTPMPVTEATSGMKVMPDSVYIIPPNQSMGIHAGKLTLEKPIQPHGLRLPIDYFLRSLAGERGSNAICVILSGTGSDGTEGLRAIKAEMGTVFVQQPESARYNGMPLSAINTGLADFVLPAAKIPLELARFVRHTSTHPSASTTDTGEKQEPPLHKVFAIIGLKTGHDFSHYKLATIRRRLQRRMSVNQVDDISKYVDFLRANPAEIQALVKDILISVTSFFRDAAAFNALQPKLASIISAKPAGEVIRVWVNGCATGEEAYSVLMLIAECLDGMENRLPVQMFATDIDSEALAIARAAVYPSNIEADITPERLKRFFIKQEQTYRIRKEIRDMVVFSAHNVIRDPPFSRMDLICCRNLLIYLDNDLQKRLLPLWHYALNPGGLLFLGSSETVGDSVGLFTVEDKKWKIYRRRQVAGYLPRNFTFNAPARVLPAPGKEPHIPRSPALEEVVEKIFFDSYSPTFAVIDEKSHLVYVRGRTGKYLEIVSGQPNLGILDMAREGLRGELGSAIFQARSANTAITRPGLQVKNNGGFQVLNLAVAPLTQPGIPPGYLLIVFNEIGDIYKETKSAKSAGPPASRRLAELEDELSGLRTSLQAVTEEHEAANEELKSANEELQSNNEELQSTNEELDTSREELQSTNEELTVVNAELQSRNEALALLNDDLANFIRRTDIAILFLDQDLVIRLFTSASTHVFNIKNIDTGRHLADITSVLSYDGIVSDAAEVMRTLQPKEMELQRRDGHWFNMRIQPYLSSSNVVSGVVMSFTDIHKQKQEEIENLQMRNQAEISSRLAAIGEMAAGIAHEVNNPLTAVVGYSELLLDRQDLAPDIREQIRIINDGSHRVKDIVRRMLTFAHQVKPVKTSASINELLDATLYLRAYVLRTANIEVIRHFDLDLPWVTVDPGQMQQVFLNLIVNAEFAMKQAHGRGTLIVTSEKVNNHVRISFTDDGTGMSPETLKKLFHPFFTTREVNEGTGLGLSLSRTIIQEHGGSIEVESEIGKGSTFIITLPIVQPAPAEPAAVVAAAPAAKVKPAHILVVDDEESIGQLVSAILSKNFHSVDATGDAAVALVRLDSAVYDLVLMDIRMPGMSGIELYAKILQKHPELAGKFLFITGDTADENARLFLESNNLPYVTKPFDRATLLSRVNELL